MLTALAIDPVSAQQAEPPVRQELPRYAFKFYKAPWTQVISLLTQITEVPFIGGSPTGAFTFIPPTTDGKEKKYTVPEIIDILNESLLEQKYMIFRRHASITLWSADVPLNPRLWPDFTLLTVDDLPNYGNTEVVNIGFHPQSEPVESLAAVVKKMIGSPLWAGLCDEREEFTGCGGQGRAPAWHDWALAGTYGSRNVPAVGSSLSAQPGGCGCGGSGGFPQQLAPTAPGQGHGRDCRSGRGD
jgi:hypothetical protein